MTDLAGAVRRYPRVALTRLPTPLQTLSRLSERTGLDVWIKRDDLTDLALGGDKPRKLEFELGAARARGADMVVTCGSSQSNHARLTTAAARHLGMECAVVLSDDRYRAPQGNLLTVQLMGAHLTVVDVEDHWDLEEHAHELCRRLREQGRRPHYVPVSGTTPTSCLGYVVAGLELADQLRDEGLDPAAVYTPFGTGGVLTASMLALRDRGFEAHFVGISVNRGEPECRDNIDRWWKSLCDLLDRDAASDRGSHEIRDRFIGEEYGDPTPAALDAIVTMAEAEGILLDPVYTGKMAAGFLADVAADRWADGATVVLVHTGGVPALFAYHEEVAAHLRRLGREL